MSSNVLPEVSGGALSRRRFLGCAAAGVAAASLALAGCGRQDDSAAGGAPTASVAASAPAQASSLAEAPARSFFAFDSLVSIQAYGATDEVLDDVQQMCERYDALFDAHSETSDIGRVNAAAGKPTEVDPDTAELISDALTLCEEFDGAFDVTIGAVSLLWDFENAVKPADADIQAGLAHVDWLGVTVDGTTVTLADPDARLDLGGVAKGWICEKVAGCLRDAGVTSGIVNLGTSSIWAIGSKPSGQGWRVGLRDPKDSLSSLLGVMEASDVAVSSSGLYDQHFEADGRDWWHILDPRTGYPVETDMLGVTVAGPSALEGDAMTTALFVMGTDAARAWLEEHRAGSVEGVFVGEDDEPTFTDGFVQTYGYVSAGASASSTAGE